MLIYTSMIQELKRTLLYEEHLKLGAKIVPFAGWEMPVFYKGIIEEHLAVRNSAGIFDISHMGVIDISGKDALDFLLKVATNDTSKLPPFKSHYSLLCNESGGVIDDILVYNLKDYFRIIVNASNTDKVINLFKSQQELFKEVNIKLRNDISSISLQGPTAKSFVKDFPAEKNCIEEWKEILQYYKYEKEGILISRTGYTGEDGFEFFIENDPYKGRPEQIWEYFLDQGIRPCGLGARDTLRLEAGLPLYGHEYNETITPLEVGYGWAVNFDNHNFIGKEALLKQKQEGIKKKLVGLKFHDKVIPRQGIKIYSGDQEIGRVTSGTFSPSLGIPVALGFVKSELANIGNIVEVEIRNKKIQAVVSLKKLV